ncbi:MAG: nicotinate-nicotinamide nucleotide adenylyltransferase [Blastocatellia bacterium]
MTDHRLKEIVERIDQSGEPRIEIVKRAYSIERRLGVFASSFNPPTTAHVELIQRAAEAYSLDETIALAGKTNADKLDYECSLEDRLAMLMLAFASSPSVSIGVSSHAFYVDIVEALEQIYPPRTELHFIVGFDTFERVLDPANQYTGRYHRQFANRLEALEYLFERSNFIVAGRAGAGLHSVKLLVERESALRPERVLYLDFPADLGELSATEVRKRTRAGRTITGLVPAAVEQHLRERGLYRDGR